MLVKVVGGVAVAIGVAYIGGAVYKTLKEVDDFEHPTVSHE
jgi:hypothetical protein